MRGAVSNNFGTASDIFWSEYVIFRPLAASYVCDLSYNLRMKSDLKSEFERMIMLHKSTVYSVCYMFAESPGETDDLFQEVLINLWNGFKKFRGESSLRTWIYKVSLNTCISYKRKRHIRTESIAMASELCTDNPEGNRQTAQLHERISRLEVVDRAIVLLWLENLSYEEIAAIIGSSPRAIGTRLVRIKQKLKSL